MPSLDDGVAPDEDDETEMKSWSGGLRGVVPCSRSTMPSRLPRWASSAFAHIQA